MSQGVQGRKSATLIADFLEHYREVSMLDIKGADANKVILVIGIMTLHSFGEEYGVGVSFASSKGNLKLKCSCWAHSQLVPFCWIDSQRLYIQGYV
ncbi:hypothetical protein Hanom_Chr16g01417401 [Helianthus anomalus]